MMITLISISRDTRNMKEKSNGSVNRNSLRALWRLACYFGITLLHVGRASALSIAAHKNRRILHRWARHLNRSLGLDVTVRGVPPEDGVLLVSNHRSYMDITAIGALAPVTFLAKMEVSRWPVLGYGCRLVDVVFVDRDSAESRRSSRDDVARRLRNRTSIVVFPEGTSYEGPGLLAFKPGIFQTAAAGGFPVMPVAIEYDDPADAWVGNDTFIRHFMQTFSKRHIGVTVTFGPLMRDDDPVRLQNSSWQWINATLPSGGDAQDPDGLYTEYAQRINNTRGMQRS